MGNLHFCLILAARKRIPNGVCRVGTILPERVYMPKVTASLLVRLSCASAVTAVGNMAVRVSCCDHPRPCPAPHDG